MPLPATPLLMALLLPLMLPELAVIAAKRTYYKGY